MPEPTTIADSVSVPPAVVRAAALLYLGGCNSLGLGLGGPPGVIVVCEVLLNYGYLPVIYITPIHTNYTSSITSCDFNLNLQADIMMMARRTEFQPPLILQNWGLPVITQSLYLFDSGSPGREMFLTSV